MEENDINGGSYRIFCKKNISRSIVYKEKTNLFRIKKFIQRVESNKKKCLSFLTNAVKKGLKVYIYGASTKGNTLLQWFGLDNTLIDGIAERSPAKFGLKTAGTNIPIYSEKEMRKAKPDYLLVLPWHFINEFIKREQKFLSGGGKLIVPCPRFEVIGK